MLRRLPLISSPRVTTRHKRKFLQSKGKATVRAHSCGWPGDSKTNRSKSRFNAPWPPTQSRACRHSVLYKWCIKENARRMAVPTVYVTHLSVWSRTATSYMIGRLHALPVLAWVSSRYCVFLPHSKDILEGHRFLSKLAIVCVSKLAVQIWSFKERPGNPPRACQENMEKAFRCISHGTKRVTKS